MRRRSVMLFVLVLGLVAALGAPTGLIAAPATQQIQGACTTTESPCEGLAFKSLPGAIDLQDGQVLQPYSFVFLQQWAAIPQPSSDNVYERMLVYVQSGDFCFKNGASGTVVHPPVGDDGKGMTIQIMQLINLGTPSAGSYCEPGDGVVKDKSGADCIEACTIDPGTVVLASKGSVVAFPGGVCVWCLLSSLSAGEEAHLLVYAVLSSSDPGSFSWTQLQGFAVTPTVGASPVPATPSARGLHMVRGWALNPGAGCDH